MKRFNPSEIEPKWQAKWAESNCYHVEDDTAKNKKYIAGMFPYPSGSGLHSGHAFSYTIVDAIARFYRAHGANVLNPMGWDTFGLPAENYAIKTGTAPAVVTKENIANFKTQFKRLGISFDWDREINTSDPEYYKWTQWIFTEFFKRGLAYQKDAMQWWCPVDKTVLANEQVEAGKCWRCGNDVEKKAMNQWFFKITNYSDALLEEIPNLDWPEKIKIAQTNWIGKSEGAEIQFPIEDTEDSLKVFTTRPDTIFGVTFMVIAPEHTLVQSLLTSDCKDEAEVYIKSAAKKSEIERMSEGKAKTGVFTGSYAINPATGESIPIWIADYVLAGYGTGAILAVPAHDERDLAFARKFELPVRQVVARRFIDPDQGFRQDKSVISRNVVTTIIKHPEGDTYLVAKPRGGSVWAPLMGGIEKGETNEEAARREIIEETGFTDFGEITSKGEVFASEFFAEHKDVNRIAYCQPVFVELMSLAKDETKAVDAEAQEFKWVSKSEFDALENAAISNQHVFKTLHDATDVMTTEGRVVNSGHFDGMNSSEAREEVVAWLESQGVGQSKTTYKMRDWLISRQRYWGAPIPIIHCPDHGAVAVPEGQLPVILPDVKNYAPTGEGSVLATAAEWVNTECPTCGKPAKRETDTMDGYACSSWYLLRYTDPNNDNRAWDPSKANYWSPLDFYVGGDHAVAHLLYVRFWAHVFNDMGLLDHKEPVKKLVYHGYVNAEDGRKMSKSLGNVIDPIDIIDQGYGADTLRTYVLFMGPIELDSAWSSKGVGGVYRFLSRVWTLAQEYLEQPHDAQNNSDLESLRHRTIKKVTNDYHALSFNTAIAALMEYVNELYKAKTNGFGTDWSEHMDTLVQLLSPFAPHTCAELWQQLGHNNMLDTAAWPKWDESKTKSATVTVVVQVNGKVRTKLELNADTTEDEAINAALQSDGVQRHVDGKPIKKTIYVPGKLVSIVV